MCGFCGFVDFTYKSNVEILANMTSTLHHRGPNDSGCDVFDVDAALIGLGHARLSILDLSPAGHQPMHFEHLSIVFNGEIYNFREIKSELVHLGHQFKTHSDTEVILHAVMEWGYSSVSKFIGMFTFAIFNKKTLVLTLIRDRAGIKPLYYYWHDGLFLFASELKAFHAHPQFIKKINEAAVHQYMDYGYIPSPHCIFQYCHKLNPGHVLSFNLGKKELTTTKYWDVNEFYLKPKLKVEYREAKNELEKLLLSAFEYRMVSDVPVGIFLSGGYDSTAVTAMLQYGRTEKLKTFTIGFDEGNNEAPYAKNIAQYIGTDHTEYYCSTKDAQEIIPLLPYYYDEPFADSSAIPTILVSKLAVQNVTVALSADAGDEIFAGYVLYKYYLNNLTWLHRIPKNCKPDIVRLIEALTYLIPSHFHLKYKIDVLIKILTVHHDRMPQELLRNIPSVKLRDVIQRNLFLNRPIPQCTAYEGDYSKFGDDLSMALAIDYTMYLQNDILTKVDRATMSASLEGREPFLDHRIIEYASQLPTEFKYGISQKRILKDIVHTYVPQTLLDRPKSGFTLPISAWLKNELSPLLESNLDKTSIDTSGVFCSEYVDVLYKKFMDDTLYDPVIIWKLLQFQLWYKMWM
jgi:asparagine synthase (glutamine-hydrolysing)